MEAYKRLINYSAYPSASDENNDCCPSTPAQLDFAHALESELNQLGMSDVTLDDNGYLFAEIPASDGCEDMPVIGFIAHMDVVDCVDFKNVKTQYICYNGGDVVLNKEKNIVMAEKEYPVLKNYIGKHLLTTDGTTLLGADDKAGIAEIITFCEYALNNKDYRHGKIMVGFTPDEEIGRGAELFDVKRFGASYAFTCDGAEFGEVVYETFNAASMEIDISGKSIHPGDAKNTMVNASMVACRFVNMLPELEAPEHTEGYEGFYHLIDMQGDVSNARLRFIIRDHDIKKLEYRKQYAVRVCNELNRIYGENTVKIQIKDNYRNMREKIEQHFDIIEKAYAAVRKLGGEPVSNPVRGGTDGSTLSFMGLPCPNLGTGSHNHHSTFEFACTEEMERCVNLLIEIARVD